MHINYEILQTFKRNSDEKSTNFIVLFLIKVESSKAAIYRLDQWNTQTTMQYWVTAFKRLKKGSSLSVQMKLVTENVKKKHYTHATGLGR